MKYLFFITVIIVCSYFLFFNGEKIENIPVSKDNNNTEEKTEIIVRLLDGKDVKAISIEEYIVGVVACEMPASFEEEALKAMSVAARTFAMSRMNNKKTYDLKDSTSDQCYNNDLEMQEKWGNSYYKYYNKIKKAVESTKGEYLTYNDKIIKALYFSISNGYTENVKDVFGGNLDYLVSVESSWDANISGFKKTISMSETEFLNKLGIKDSDVYKIKIEEYTESSRVSKITVNSQTFKGTKFRSLLNLRSTDFSLEKKGDKISITTKGYGHGVGLSQYGSNEMAKNGKKYIEILKYYYKNVILKSA